MQGVVASRLSCDDFKDEEMATTAPPSARGEEVVEHVSLLKKLHALAGNTQVDGHYQSGVKKMVCHMVVLWFCQIRWKVHEAWLRE